MSEDRPTTSPTASGGADPAAPLIAACPASAVHARLQIKSVTFSGGHPIDNDTFGNFPTPHFLVGRGADPAPRIQRPAQFPYAVVRATRLGVTAVFQVTQQPTAAEAVAVDAVADVDGTRLQFSGSVNVGPADSEVTTAVLSSDVAVPDRILKVAPLQLDWFQTPCDIPRTSAGTSTNPLYVTLAAPTTAPLYWTLLEVSCAAAAGETSVAGLRSNSYGALQGRAITRARDGHNLTYWNPRTTRASSTRLLLAATDGSGQCGSWAEFLIDMWKAHGDDGGHKVGVARSISDWLNRNPMPLFLVKDWRFDPPHPADPSSFSYEFKVTCFELPGVPGQNSPNPPPHFLNHFIVIADGQFYDPSYGSAPFANKLAWENASIDGLGNGNYQRGNHGGYRKAVLAATQLLEFVDLTTSAML